ADLRTPSDLAAVRLAVKSPRSSGLIGFVADRKGGPIHETLAPRRADDDGKCGRRRRLNGIYAEGVRPGRGCRAHDRRPAHLPRELWRLWRHAASRPRPRT